MTDSPASGLPSEETRQLVDDPLANNIARIIELAAIRHGADPADLEGTLDDAAAILALIRPAFEAKEREIERIKNEVELTMMSLIFVPAIRAAIEALPEEDDLQPYRARAEAALAAEAKLAQAVEALDQIAAHPERHEDAVQSYAVGWAFWNVQRIARAASSAIQGETEE